MKAFDRWLNRNPADSNFIRVRVNEIVTSPYQPRREFNEDELRELAQSIEEVGLIQPLVVRKTREGWQLVAGERRLRACRMVGLTEVPAVILDIDDRQAAAIGLIENLQRKDLNYFEEAYAYARLIGEFGMTQEEVASSIGKSQSAIANKLRLLRLDQDVVARIDPEVITERHARALLRLENYEDQLKVLDSVYENDLNVKTTETLVEKIRQNISREINSVEGSRSVSFILKDARIFLNTIKEMAKRTRDKGVNLLVVEKETEDQYELVITVPKVKKMVNNR